MPPRRSPRSPHRGADVPGRVVRYDPVRVAALRQRALLAADDLAGIVSDDPAASTAVRTAGAARTNLEAGLAATARPRPRRPGHEHVDHVGARRPARPLVRAAVVVHRPPRAGPRPGPRRDGPRGRRRRRRRRHRRPRRGAARRRQRHRSDADVLRRARRRRRRRAVDVPRDGGRARRRGAGPGGSAPHPAGRVLGPPRLPGHLPRRAGRAVHRRDRGRPPQPGRRHGLPVRRHELRHGLPRRHDPRPRRP